MVGGGPHRQLVQQDRSGGRAGDELLRLGICRKQQRPHKFWSEADYYIESVGRAVGAPHENGMGGSGIVQGVCELKPDVGLQYVLCYFCRLEATVTEDYGFWIHVAILDLVVKGYDESARHFVAQIELDV